VEKRTLDHIFLQRFVLQLPASLSNSGVVRTPCGVCLRVCRSQHAATCYQKVLKGSPEVERHIVTLEEGIRSRSREARVMGLPETALLFYFS
jgi:hypothetical protein